MFIQQYLKNYLKAHPESNQNKIALLLDVDRQVIHNYVNGKSEPNAEMGYKILKRLGASKEVVETYILDSVKKAYGSTAFINNDGELRVNLFDDTDIEQQDGKYPLYKYPLPSNKKQSFNGDDSTKYHKWSSKIEFILDIKGQSLQPIIPDGCLAGVKVCTEVIPGKLMLLNCIDENGCTEYVLKYAAVLDGSYELLSTNKEYKSIVPIKSCEIIGYVADIYMEL